MDARKGTKRSIVVDQPSSSGDYCEDVYPFPPHACHVMQNLDNIVQNVMSYFTMRTLHTVGRVCHKWNELVKLEKKKRRQVYWTLAEIHRTHHVVQYIANPIQNSYSLPKVALLFVTNELFQKKLEVPRTKYDGWNYNSGVRIIPKRLRRTTSVELYMKYVLPPDCQICGLVVDGVVGTYSNSMNMNEIENNDAVSCLTFPTLQHVTITRFHLTEAHLDSLHLAKGDLRAVTDMPEDHEAILTLLFYENYELSSMPVAPARIILENKSCRVVAGAIVSNMLRDNIQTEPLYISDGEGDGEEAPVRDDEGRDVTGVIFSVPQGSTDVKVASVYLDEDVVTEAEAKEKMRQLKKCNIPERNTVGFLMACCSRGEEHYSKANVESSVFHQVFPKVPLVGVFAQGEICHDYLPDYSSAESLAAWEKKPCPEMHHSMTSCVVLLHLGAQGGRIVV